jgi:hypothetical protein
MEPIKCPSPKCRKGILSPCNDREYRQFQYSKDITSDKVVQSSNGFFNTLLFTHLADEILVACNCCTHHHVVKKSRIGL